MTDDIHYERFDPAKNWEMVLFSPDRTLQSAELNDLQRMLLHRVKSVADGVFSEGDIIEGGTVVVNADTGQVQCQSALVYVAGAVRKAPAASLTIPVKGNVSMGVHVMRSIIDASDDTSLLNPAVGTHGQGEPGACREVVTVRWGWRGDGVTDTHYCDLWQVDDGRLRPRESPPGIDAIGNALARYDSDSSGGHYVVRGLTVKMGTDLPTGEQVYHVGEGSARIAGRGLELGEGRRLVYPATPDLLDVDSEPHTSDTVAAQTITFDRFPAIGPVEVRITVRTTSDITHAGFTDGADLLPNTAVLKVETVQQGGVVYREGVDYKVTAGRLDWSLAGTEPAPGSTYKATYTHWVQASVTDLTPTSCKVANALPGTLMLVTYKAALRRWDRLVMTSEGLFSWVKGVPSDWNPLPPQVPQGSLALASVYQSWMDNGPHARRIAQDGTRMVSMQELNAQSQDLDQIRLDLAEMRLRLDVQGRYSGVRKGLFADPFMDDSMRDAGQIQDANIFEERLHLPLKLTVTQLGTTITERVAVAHTHTPVVSQPARTSSMLVNPYAAFDRLPGALTLTPAVDRWTEVNTQWAQPLALNFFTGAGVVTRLDRQASEVTSRDTSTALATLRQIDVQITATMGPGEGVTRFSFDGQAVALKTLAGAANPVADSAGVLQAKFTVPAGVPAGTKTVELVGTGGSTGTGTFTGQGTRIDREQQQVTRFWYQRFDPLAQTLTLAETGQCSGVELWFTARQSGSSVLVQLREVDAGYPSPRVLAERNVKTVNMAPAGQPTRITWPPVLLTGGQEYAIVVLCDDAITACAIAKLGEWDENAKRWVQAQPYQVGVLLSSSNASTWTAHQSADLAFNLLQPQYTATERLMDLGTVDLVDATDLMVLAHVHEPQAGISAHFVMTRLKVDGTELDKFVTTPRQVVQLPTRTTGKVKVQVRLGARDKLSAVLEPGIQLVAASLQTSGSYISPAITAGGSSRVRVVFDADLPPGTTAQVHAQAVGTTTWVAVPFLQSSPMDTGTLELTHELPSITANAVRVRLTLNGTHLSRPTLRNLRVAVL